MIAALASEDGSAIQSFRIVSLRHAVYRNSLENCSLVRNRDSCFRGFKLRFWYCGRETKLFFFVPQRGRIGRTGASSLRRESSGAAVHVARPLADQEVAGMTHEPTIFIVDDEKAVRESVAALLRVHKLPVELFATGEEFLAAVDGTRCGCLVADMRLAGGMNGVQLHQALIKRGVSLPLIMITGHFDEKAAQEALTNGALCVLQKPVPYKKLLDQVRQGLAIAAGQQSANGDQ
jgi:CheY-like chemotaxis protein